MKKFYVTFIGIILSSYIAFASVGNNSQSDSWDLKLENLNSKEKIEISFSEEAEFYSYLENNTNLIAFEDGDICSSTTTITIGVASSFFTMKGDCNGFTRRLAVRVREMQVALTAEISEPSWWNSLVDWWNS
jgi:hypothetical protein